VIDPFNPPGRLLLFRTSALGQRRPGSDSMLYRQIHELGSRAGIATRVRHRHLSLLNLFDYPSYSLGERNEFFGAVNRSGRTSGSEL
jgi:hypothetical protein